MSNHTDRFDGQNYYLHEQLTYFILFIAPFVFGYSLIYQPTTYGKLHHSNNNNKNNTTNDHNNNGKDAKAGGRRLFQILHLGPLLPARPCWILFECPPIIFSIYGYYNIYNNSYDNDNDSNHNIITTIFMLSMFFVHYLYRCLIYPLFIMPSTSRGFPIALLLLGTIPYTTINGL